MHESVLAFLRENLTPEMVKGKTILEAGSLNINGSARQIVEPMEPWLYTGVDLTPGYGVDLVADFSVERSRFLFHADVVISVESLEHALDWRGFVRNLKRAATDGLLIVTTRSPGFPFHNPPDHWRYAPHHMEAIFADMNILKLERDPQVPGVFMMAKGFKQDQVDLSKIEVAKAPQA